MAARCLTAWTSSSPTTARSSTWSRSGPGAFTRDVGKGGRWVNLMLGHSGDDGDRYLGRCVALEEQSDGLYPTFRIDRSHPQAEAARAGELTGWSVSARVSLALAESTRPDGTRAVRREVCGLSHVAATAAPQYAGSGVLVAREHVIVTGTSSTPRLDALRVALRAELALDTGRRET